jgi:predicted PurR-regulated permease PerM
VFFLIRREDLRDRFIHLVGEGRVTVTTQMLEDANARVSRYLSMLFLVNVTFGICVGIGLYLIGVPSAILCIGDDPETQPLAHEQPPTLSAREADIRSG